MVPTNSFKIFQLPYATYDTIFNLLKVIMIW